MGSWDNLEDRRLPTNPTYRQYHGLTGTSIFFYT